MHNSLSLQEPSNLPVSQAGELDEFANEADASRDELLDTSVGALDAFPSETVLPVPPTPREPADLQEPSNLPVTQAGELDEFVSEADASRDVLLDTSVSALDAFPSETVLPVPPTSREPEDPTRATASEMLAMSLRDVQRAGVAFERDEAVAIAQSLCSVFSTTHLLPRTAFDRMRSNIELSLATSEAVLIDATGRVLVSADGPRCMAEAIQCVDATLSDMLPAADPLSIGVRVASKAVTSFPQHESLDALSQALTAYEFRNRREVIGGLFQRATKRTSPETTVTKLKPLPILTNSSIRRPDVAAIARAAWERAGRLLWGKAGRVVAMCAVAVSAVGVGGWMIWSQAPHPEPNVSAATQPPDTSHQKETLPPSPELRKPGRSQPRAAAAPSAPANPTERSVTPAVFNGGRPVKQRPFPSGAVRTGASAADMPEVPTVASAIDGGIPTASIEAIEATPPAAPIPSRIERGPVDSSTREDEPSPIVEQIFDRDSRDVTPPSVMYPQLSGILSTETPGIRSEVLTIAVVVGKDGTVHSVKAVTPPRSIGESLVLLNALSAVKSARFRPAIKQAMPVKYRLIVPVRVSQVNQ